MTRYAIELDGVVGSRRFDSAIAASLWAIGEGLVGWRWVVAE